MDDETNLSGLWTGTYAYSGLEEPPVAIVAWLQEQAMQITGAMLEPNTIAPVPIQELSAEISGIRKGLMLVFTKKYASVSGVHKRTIFYEGAIDGAFKKITGEWMFGDPRLLSGTFQLLRSSPGISKAVSRRAKAPLEPV